MSIKVLVADDSITIQKVIGIIFGGDEYSLTVVDNGKAAVDKAREINPDILLIDALMPGMNGYEVAEAVRSTPSLATKPILILTGSFEPFDEEKAKKSGADDFIAKPFESQQIITKVKELLALGNSRTQSTQTPSPQPAAEVPYETTPDVSASTFEFDAAPQPEAVEQQAAPTDIWGAFTPEIETSVKVAVSPADAVPLVETIETDVFAIVTEENDAQLLQAAISTNTSPQHTGSEWVPVEENTFEFEDETIVETQQNTLAEQTLPIQEPSFGDIDFEEVEETTSTSEMLDSVPEQITNIPEPIFSAPVPEVTYFETSEPVFEVPAIPAAPFAPLADPAPVFIVPAEAAPTATITPSVAASSTPPATLTEEQLRDALATASKEVIERIVWEVVPDLAEAVIREAIRKIKEGA